MAIATTFLLAYVLTIVPLPSWLSTVRPEWVALVIIYWCMALPGRIGIGTAWLSGLLLDVLTAGLLGQHALSFALIAFITIQLYQRLRLFPLWQQALTVLLMVILHLMIIMWIKGVTGATGENWSYWLPAVSSMLLWPAVFITLREVRRRYNIK
ncbi:MAG: rod shape-determining protein MreD [Gammaproteobacteria bacterium]|nr:rod shape-determining protein MreD [Gammaproteobacteria bacterium]